MREQRKVVEAEKELAEGRYSVTNPPDHPRQQSLQHVSWL